LLLFRHKYWLQTLFQVLSITALLSAGGRSANAAPMPALVVVLVPGLRAADLSRSELSALGRLIAEGGSGWMVCRGARATDSRLLRADGRESEASLLLTLGSGARALAPNPEIMDKNAFAALQAANARLDHAVPLGALGDLLHRRNLTTATLGDKDRVHPDGDAATIAMDGSGHVDLPMTRSGLISDATAAFGVRTDVSALLADFSGLFGKAGLIVLSCSELDRADRYAPFCRPTVAAGQRAAACRTLNTLLTAVLERCRPRDGLPAVPILLLSPAPAASSDERIDRLAPVVWWGSGDAPGTLRSASTRRAGLVLNTDVLATVAARLNLPLPPGATGRPFHSERSPAALNGASLAADYERWIRVSRLQNSPGGLPTLQMMLPLLGTLLLLWSIRAPDGLRMRLHHAVGTIAVFAITVPLGMLVLPLLDPPAPWAANALLAALLLGTGFFCLTQPSRQRTLFRLMCRLTLFLLLVDLLTGTHLLQSAWMSYSVVEAARFYGIGNEYMGVVIGAACALFGLRMSRTETGDARAGAARIAGFATPYVALTLAMGVFGAKVGAIPSAGTAFGILALVWNRGRIGLKEIGGLLLLTMLGLGLLALFDARHAAGDQTHFIRALTGAGGGSLPEIMLRKLQLETWLLLHSAWSGTLIVSACALLWIRRTFPQAFTTRSARAALLGIASGALACLLCNDSGLTAASLLFLYGWAWAALETVAEKEHHGAESPR
jgi:hypothetical protein